MIEVFKNSNVWEELGNKVLGSPINLRFRELFKIEQLTEKIQKHIVQKNVKIKNNVYLTTNSGRFLADGIASDLFLVNLK